MPCWLDMPPSPLSLNIDLAEPPSEPDELYELATIVNVACGGHAGDELGRARRSRNRRSSSEGDSDSSRHPCAYAGVSEPRDRLGSRDDRNLWGRSRRPRSHNP